MVALAALALYVVWTAATYLLEGRRKTFHKPASSNDRLVYAVVANMLIGTIGSVGLIRWFMIQSGAPWPAFAGPRSTALSVAAGLVLGVVLLAVQRPATRDLVILANAYAQTLVVSIAEVLVCWAVVGAAVALTVANLGTIAAMLIGLLVASILFGVYHFAHTAPFNTLPLVIGLSVVGLATGIFFAISRDVFGTIVFHNFFALKGVADALSRRGLLDQFRRAQPLLIVVALVAVGLLVAARVILLRGLV
jgi:hypothetical protein